MLIPDPSVLGTVVRQRRNDLGMSQTDLARAVGTTRQWLSRFEQSSNDVSVSIIFAILKELELELEISELGAAERGSVQQTPINSVPAILAPPIPAPVNSTPATPAQEPMVAAPPILARPLVAEPPAANPEPRPDRFALLRSRDALSGLRPPRPAQQVEVSEPDPAPGSGTAQHGLLDKKKRADASVRMDQDIARIRKSSLFKR